MGRTIEGETVLVLPVQGEVKVINEVGSQIWQLADGQRSIAEIAAQICQQYAVEPAQAETDTLQFVRLLVEKGILSLV